MWLPFLLPIFVFCAVMAMSMAKNNGRNPYGWFCMGILFGPLALAVGLMPSRKPVEEAGRQEPSGAVLSDEISLKDETKPCPLCHKAIGVEAAECRFCGATFDPAEVELQVGSRRAELREKWEQDLKRCPTCGRWDVHEAYIEDGSWDDWCPHCARSLKMMKQESPSV